MDDAAVAALGPLSSDDFLGGRLTLAQPRGGYRAGVDPVFLAAAVPARPGDRVLDIGCGAGTALFCLMARVSGLAATGVEVQPDYAALARRNAAANGYAAQIHCDDIFAPSGPWARDSYDHVLTNPPYFDRNRGSQSGDAGRERGLGEAAPIADWLDACLRRLSPGGRLTLIQRAERLADVLGGLDARVGDIAVRPLAPRPGRAAKLIVVSARKGARGPLVLEPPETLHAGDRHLRDGDDYAGAARAVLRDARAWPWVSG